MKRYGEDIPQVLAIVKTGLGWKIPLKKVVRKELESLGNRIFLRDEREITLVSGGPGSSGSIELERNILMLPEGVVGKLGLARGSAVCFVRREQGAAIKKMVLEESQGQTAMAVDIESDLLVRRVMMVNPSPEAALSLFRETYANASLQFPVAPFAASSESIPGLALRRILGLSRADDDSLRRRLVNKRLSERLSDGSWEGDPVLTASMARDLLDLGEEPQASGLPRTTDWLLSRRESAYNPGMFFLSDELVDEQRRIVGLRADGHRVRFRERKRRELKHVLPYDPLVIEPCGPRIMWPNAFVLDALLALGQEDHQRVRRALTSLTKGRWCECGYQNGVVDRASTNLESDAELTKLETETKQLFRYGGLKGPEELMKMDLTKSSGPKMFRISEEKVNGTREYRLSFPNDFPTCGFVTMNALGRLKDRSLRRFAGAEMTRMAANLPKYELSANDETVRFYRFPVAATISAFSRYDHPVAKATILRFMPWVIASQNPDGSWGADPVRDETTLAVVSAVDAVHEYLPAGFLEQT